MKTYKLEIKGKVQGVWYRATAKDKALELNLTGKIWNEYDGDVGAIIQGPLDNIFAFIEWCKEGPTLAKVDDVSESEIIDDDKIYGSFEIVTTR
ncbi:MAG: acylphosphatase [Bacteroidota bacterium]|nr:acylphosphatase [Bacteroidota bacterium]